MSDFRFDVGASAGPARAALVGGGAQLLVRVRLFDGAGVVDRQGRPSAKPDACCDVCPQEARELAAELLAAAERADQQTREAGRWEQPR